jgi:hypothetical protein
MRDGVTVVHNFRQMIVVYQNKVQVVNYESGMHASKAANHFNPSQFSSCSFSGNESGPVLQNAHTLPLDHDFSFQKVKKEAQHLLDQEVRRLDGKPGIAASLNFLHWSKNKDSE